MKMENEGTGVSQDSGVEEVAERDFRKATEETSVRLRNDIKDIAKKVQLLSKALKASPMSRDEDRRDLDEEMIANVILAYRHLEDASMRLGKMIQASQGGVSIYDKTIENESSAVGS